MKFKVSNLKIVIKKTIFLITIIVVILSILQLFKLIDYNRVLDKKQPLFCMEKYVMLDGGSVMWRGLGYEIIDFSPSCGYHSVKVGSWNMNTKDISDEILEFGKTHEHKEIVIHPFVYKGKIDIKQSFDIKGYSSDFEKMMEIINKAEFDSNPIEIEDLEYTIIVVEIGNNVDEYTLYERENETYLIKKNIGKYKFEANEATEIKNLISEIMQTNSKYYGDSYKTRALIIRFVIAIILIISIVVIIIKKYKKKQL